MTVAVVGLDGNNEGEGHDRANTTLVGVQSELVQALMAAVGPDRLVVVLVNGGSLSVDWIKHNCPTVVEAFEGGQSGGQALAEVLSGAVAPSGVLPYTMYPAEYLDQVTHWGMSMRTAPGKPNAQLRLTNRQLFGVVKHTACCWLPRRSELSVLHGRAAVALRLLWLLHDLGDGMG